MDMVQKHALSGVLRWQSERLVERSDQRKDRGPQYVLEFLHPIGILSLEKTADSRRRNHTSRQGLQPWRVLDEDDNN